MTRDEHVPRSRVQSKDRALKFRGDVAQMVERSLSMREALGSMPSFSTLLAPPIMAGAFLPLERRDGYYLLGSASPPRALIGNRVAK